jgi:hypothetical protein
MRFMHSTCASWPNKARPEIPDGPTEARTIIIRV